MWLRVYLSVLPLAVLVLVLCGAWALKSNFEGSMARERARAMGDHAMLVGALQTRLEGVERGAGESAQLREAAIAAAARSYARYYTGDDVALRVCTADGRALYTGLTDAELEAMALEPVLGQRMQVARRLDARTLLFVSGYLDAGESVLRVDLMRDISGLVADARAFARQLSLLMLGAAVALAAGLCVLISAAMRPLAALTSGARAMAQGDYERRIEPGSGEVGALADAFNDMAGAVRQRVSDLEDAARDRELFIANLAHEMKTPMTTILGYSDLLHRAALTDAQREAALRGIRSEGAKLDALSGHLLQLQRVQRGESPIDARDADIPALIEAARGAVALQAERAQVAVRSACTVDRWQLDPGLFELLLTNLLENAIKASPPGREVLISARAEDDAVLFSVADRGRGIPPSALAKVRQPFYMVDPQRARSQRGAGLGLALCDAIAKAHGASLSIESREGEGTTVSVRLDNSFTADGPIDETGAV